MNISVVELINYIKFQLSTGSNKDPVVDTITDEEIDILIKIHCGTLALEYPEIPFSYMQLMSCLIRKELYWKLATSSAPMYELKTDGTELKKGDRFQHYLALIQEVNKEYNDIMNNPSRLPEDFNGGGKIASHTMVLEKDYVLRNYVNSQKIPKVKVKVDSISTEYVELSLDLSKVDKTDYFRTNIYINNKNKIRDEYSLNANLSEGTELKYQTYNPNKDKVRIPCKFDPIPQPKTDLDVSEEIEEEELIPRPRQTRYILLEVELKYKLKAYCEIEVSI